MKSCHLRKGALRCPIEPLRVVLGHYGPKVDWLMMSVALTVDYMGYATNVLVANRGGEK